MLHYTFTTIKSQWKLNEQYAIENKENVVQSGLQKDNQSGLWEC